MSVPSYVMRSVRQSIGLSKLDTSKDDKILRLSGNEIFRLYCDWHGLINWSGILWDTVKLLEDHKGE